MAACGHGNMGSFQCHQLSMQNVRRIHLKYYTNADLESKKNYILQHVEFSTSKTKSSPLPDCYSILEGIVEIVKVCRKALLDFLHESRDRVRILCEKYLQTGVASPETCKGVRQAKKY
ncbi:hypothetical protein PR048_013293 [Dryococelus australis]|uniref:Uncharacterized protein n=1 Tax=Dryococelus australis TaxID=614101 RepID=A0ABQ9HT97_9NEOP|nr:hypothetical protein PR048_013293 [Dryococelus australis]